MNNIFRAATKAVRKSTLLIPVYVAFIILLVIGVKIFVEDYNTSRLGYLAIPTKKYDPNITYFVALLPQIGQICFAYFYGYDTKKRWALMVALSLLAVDMGTDIMYKMDGDSSLALIAAIESFLIYTIGSELAIIVSAGMLIELLPDLFKRKKKKKNFWENMKNEFDPYEAPYPGDTTIAQRRWKK